MKQLIEKKEEKLNKNNPFKVVTKLKIYIGPKSKILMGYDKSTLKSYIEAMKEASEIIEKANPDYILAPMAGSIPFIDAMSIINKDFDYSKTVYMPASSRIKDIEKISREWYYNFLKDNVDFPYRFPKVLGIDEVVSGQSVVRCMKAIDLASQQIRKEIREDLVEKIHSNKGETIEALYQSDIFTDNKYSLEFSKMKKRTEKEEYKTNKEKAYKDSSLFIEIIKGALNDKLKYKTIGIEDSKKQDRCKEYNNLKEEKRITPVPIKDILTMDNPNYNIAQFTPLEEIRNKNHIVQYNPIVKGFNITPEYLEFLTNLANYVGRNPHEIAPVNLNSILTSKKYLPQERSKDSLIQPELF